MSDSQDFWEEAFFSAFLVIVGIVFLVASSLTPIDELTGLNARSLPMVISAAIGIYGLVSLTIFMRSARGHAFPKVTKDGIVLTIMVPLTVSMILYVSFVEALGYLTGTALVLTMVLWIFGVRNILLVPALAIMAAIVSNFIFVGLFGMFMPDGWLVEWFIEALRA